MKDTHATTESAQAQFSSSELVVECLRAVISQLNCPSDDTRISMIEQAIEQVEFLEAKIRRLHCALDEANQRTNYAMESFSRFKSDIHTKAAIAAMQGVLANPDQAADSMVAQEAVWHADKLIAELEKRREVQP